MNLPVKATPDADNVFIPATVKSGFAPTVVLFLEGFRGGAERLRQIASTFQGRDIWIRRAVAYGHAQSFFED